MKRHEKIWAIAGGMTVALAFYAGVLVGRPRPSRVVESAEPEVRRVDGSLVIRRDPSSPVPPQTEQPQPGATRTRFVKVELDPLPEPRTLELEEWTAPDGSRRFVAREGGMVRAAVDVPLVQRRIPRARPWAIGAGVALRGGRLEVGPSLSWTWGRVELVGSATKSGANFAALIRFP